MKKTLVLSALFSVIFIFSELLQVFRIIPGKYNMYLKAALLLFIILFYAAVKISFRKVIEKKSEKKSILYAVSAGLLSLCTVFYSVYYLYCVLVAKNIKFSDIRLFSSPYFYIIYCVLGLVAAVYFCMVCVCPLSGESFSLKNPIWAIMPPLWLCYGLIVQFAESISSAGNIESSMKVLSAVASMLFFFSQAKALVFGSAEGNANASFGLLALVFSFSSSVSFFISFIKTPAAFSLDIAENALMLSVSFYALFYLCSLKFEKT